MGKSRQMIRKIHLPPSFPSAGALGPAWLPHPGSLGPLPAACQPRGTLGTTWALRGFGDGLLSCQKEKVLAAPEGCFGKA